MNTPATPTDPPQHAPATPLERLKQWLRGHDRGTVAVTFILTFPLVLGVLGIMTQYALEVNAQLVVNHALAAAARSAMTALPMDHAIDNMGNTETTGAFYQMDEAYPTDQDYAVDVADADGIQHMDGVDYVNRAARMQVESISPLAKVSPSEAGTQMMAALISSGVGVQSTYASRYTYAESATSVSWQRVDANNTPIAEAMWQPADFAKAAGQRIKLTVTYQFYLNVPFPFAGLQRAIGTQGTFAGVNGYFKTLTASCYVQLAPGREAVSDGNGLPQ